MILTSDKKLIRAFKNEEDLRSVYFILKNDLTIKEPMYECKDVDLGALECNRLGISRGSYLAAIIKIVKLLK